MLRQLKNYFHFNRGERRGLIVLFTILSLLILAHFYLPHIFQPPEYDLTELRDEAKKYKDEQKNKAQAAAASTAFLPPKESNRPVAEYFLFDPNLLDEKGWQKLGLSTGQIKVILNYRKAGGNFSRPQDLSKIYSISAQEYEKLLPYIRIDNSERAEHTDLPQASRFSRNSNRQDS